jgi:hypothetical protein
MLEKFKNGMITGVGIFVGITSSYLLAVTVSSMNTFSTGEPLSSSKLNENFGNLKTTFFIFSGFDFLQRTSSKIFKTGWRTGKCQLPFFFGKNFF